MNFTVKPTVSGRFRVHFVLMDDGRDESQRAGQEVQGAKSQEHIFIVEADAENTPPTYVAVQNITIAQLPVICRNTC